MNSNNTQPLKKCSFAEWSVLITSALGIDKNNVLVLETINGKFYSITVSDFFTVCFRHKGWQDIIISSCNGLCKQVILSSNNYTKEDFNVAKELVLKYLTDFTISAINAGYDDFDKE